MKTTAGISPRTVIVSTAIFAATVLIASCGTSTRWEKTPEPSGRRVMNDTGQPARSSSGNPAFYDQFGKRYYVLASSAKYKERGVASWYGNKFHGKRTSSGEPYDMYAMTAAHKTLPLPTRVRVTNLRNGRSVVVMVNDRGPFIDNRIIDMSYAAAQSLDMTRAGTTLVEVVALPFDQRASATQISGRQTPETVAQAPSTAAELATIAPAAGPVETLYLQVGAFGEQTNAAQLKQRLNAGGITNVLIHEDTGPQPVLYRVRIGPVKDVAQYDALVKRTAEFNIRDTHLVTEYLSGNTAELPANLNTPPEGS